jgi:hypothetical protein
MRGRNHGRVGFILRGAIVLAVLMLRPLTASAAPVLLGDSVQAELFGGIEINTQFTSPAVVGDGVEFSDGWVRTAPRMSWFVWIDIGPSSFTIGWTGNGFSESGHNPAGVFGISLSGLDFTPAGTITGVTRTGYTCVPRHPSIPVCNDAQPIDPILSFSGNSINLSFETVRNRETYTFDIAVGDPTPTPVPEPASLALLGTGFATFIAGRYRRRGAKSSN